MSYVSRERARSNDRGAGLGDAAGLRRKDAFVTDLKFAMAALTAQRRTIGMAVGAGVLLAVLYIWITPPLYKAKAEILIDPRKQDIVSNEIVQSGLGTSSLGADTFMLDSQVQLLRSQSVLRRLIEEQKLTEDGEFVSGPGNMLVSAVKTLLKGILRGPQARGIPETSAMDRALEKLGKRLDFEREGNTYVLAVSMTSEDPAKAATIANAITRIYVEENAAASRTRLRDVETMLSGRLGELREAALEAQRKVEAFRAANGLVGADKIPLVEQQLRELNQQQSIAAAATSKAKARWGEVLKLKEMPLERALAGGSLQSNLLTSLQAQYATLAAQEASLSTSLLPRHPNVAAIRDSKAALRQRIAAELGQLVNRAKVDVEVAVANEAAIGEQVRVVKDATAESNRAGIGLNELEREAAAATAIYQEFLARSKDAREQVSLPIGSVRVVSEAFAPTRPSWPAEFLVLAAGAFAGLAIGVLMALMLALFSGAAKAEPKSALVSVAAE